MKKFFVAIWDLMIEVGEMRAKAYTKNKNLNYY